MIDPQWSLVDLDPQTWRALGPLFDPGQYIRTAQPDNGTRNRWIRQHPSQSHFARSLSMACADVLQ